MDWFTSIEGILTLVFGSIGLGTISANIITSIKNVASGKKILNLNTALIASQESLEKSVKVNESLVEQVEEKDKQIAAMELAKIEDVEINKLLLTAMSYVVSASGGIDDVTKIQLITDMNNAKEKVSNSFKELIVTSEEKAKEVKEELLEKKNEILEKTADTALGFLDGAKNKAEEIINKHAKR